MFRTRGGVACLVLVATMGLGCTSGPSPVANRNEGPKAATKAACRMIANALVAQENHDWLANVALLHAAWTAGQGPPSHTLGRRLQDFGPQGDLAADREWLQDTQTLNEVDDDLAGKCGLAPVGSSQRASQLAVALGSCTEPEVRPTFWTRYCGDAGYQLTDLVYSRWDSNAAVATGTAVITHGDRAGSRFRVRVTFDQPLAAAPFGNRRLFSRAVVAYLQGLGPEGQRREVWDLRDMWADARALMDQTAPPCGVNDCAPDPTSTGG